MDKKNKKRRMLVGEEKEQMLILLNLIKDKSDYQTAFIETYYHAGKEYEVIYGFSDIGPTPYIEEITYDI